MFAEWLLRTGWQAAVLAVMVLLAQHLFGRWLSPQWRYRLWGLVVLRLMLPVLPASPFSLFNFDPVSRAVLPAGALPQGLPGTGDATAPLPPAAPGGQAMQAGGRGPESTAHGLRVEVRTTPPPLWGRAPETPSLAPTAVPVDAAPDALHVFLLAWATGAAVLTLRLAWGHVTFARRLRRATPLADDAAHALLTRCAREIGLRRPPRVLVTDAVHGPALCGLLRPMLLLPPGLTWRLEPDELRMVFLHELAHLRCRDVLANWLLEALQVMHWFNPVLWVAFARCRADREMARDEMVLDLIGRDSPNGHGAAAAGPAERYGQVLLKLLQQTAFAPPRMAQAVGMVGVLDSLCSLDLVPRRGRITQRIRMISTFTRGARSATRFPLVALLLVLGIGCTALTGAKDRPAGGKPKQPTAAAKAPRAAEDEGAVVTRLYDIRDLLVTVPDFDDAPPLGISRPMTRPVAEPGPTRLHVADARGSTTQPAEPGDGQTREQLTRDVINLVTGVVDPDSWRDAGGTTGALRELHGQLIVTQSVRNHRHILQLLEQLRETRAIQVKVEARILAVDPEAWKQLGIDWPPEAPPGAGQRETPTVLLSDVQVNQLLKATQANVSSTIVQAPRLTLFNGQRAYVLISTQHAYVSNLKVNNEQGRASYDPEISTVEHGMVFDAQATASADRKHVTLTLRPRIVTLLGFKEHRLPPPAEGEGAVFQEPELRLSEVRTVVTVPDGGTVLLGGLEDPDGALLEGARGGKPVAAGAATRPAATRPAGARKPRALLMLVRPKIIIQPEAEQQQFPLLKTTVGGD